MLYQKLFLSMLPSIIHNFYVKSESRVFKGCKGMKTRNFIADYFFFKNGYQGVYEDADIRYQNRFCKKIT